MDILPASTRMMQRLGAFLALSGLLFAAALVTAHATSAARDGTTGHRYKDTPALQERSVLPRIAIVRAALTPQPNRPKYLGGFSDKAHPGAGTDCTPASAPFATLPQQDARPPRRACSRSSLPRAPPLHA